MDDGWIFDSVMGFLKSPMWVHPIQSFIDEYCIIFNREDEHKFSYTQVHEEFRQLIDRLLEEHLNEMGVSQEQFLECINSDKYPDLHKVVTEYILAMDDFMTFKQMMEKRNIQLEYQTIIALQKQKEAELEAIAKLPEEEQVKLALLQSIKEQEMRDREREIEEAQLKHAIAMSLALAQESENKQGIEQTSEHVEEQNSILSRESVAITEHSNDISNEAAIQSKEVEASETEKYNMTPNEESQSSGTQIDTPQESEQSSSTLSSTEQEEKNNQYIQNIKDEKLYFQSLDPEEDRIRRLELEKFKQLQELKKGSLEKKDISPNTSHVSALIHINSTSSEVIQSPLKPLSRPLLKKESNELKSNYLKLERESLLRQTQLEREHSMKSYKEELEKQKKIAEQEISEQRHQPQTKNSQLSQMEEKRLAMRIALARKLKEDLLGGESIKPKKSAPTIEEMTARVRQADEERKREETLMKVEGLQSKFENVSTVEADDFTFAEK